MRQSNHSETAFSTFARVSPLKTKKVSDGFTLLELLITVAVIGILAGMLFVALSGVQKDARIAKTQATIRKLNEIILNRWEEFRYRGVKVDIPEEYLMPIQAGTSQGRVPVTAREAARIRMIMLRDLMRMEMPDQYRDLEFPPTLYQMTATDPSTNNPVSLYPTRNTTAEYNAMRSKFGLPRMTVPVGMGSSGTVASKGIYDSAELLYQIVASSYYNGSNGLEFFRETEIGDVDGDGFPEFVDAWGIPICFIRWPAGYGDPGFATGTIRPADSLLNDRTVPDPLDPLKTDFRAKNPIAGVDSPWMLVPLIVSAGPDGEFNLVFDSGVNYQLTTAVGAPSGYTNPYYIPNPWQMGARQGALVNTASRGDDDNITNYTLLLQ